MKAVGQDGYCGPEELLDEVPKPGIAEEAPQALAYQEQGHARGKVVLVV